VGLGDSDCRPWPYKSNKWSGECCRTRPTGEFNPPWLRPAGFFGRPKGKFHDRASPASLRSRIAERVIIWQLLRDDHDERWSLTEFRVEINHMEPSALSNALERLERHGVAAMRDPLRWWSSCSRDGDAGPGSVRSGSDYPSWIDGG
jgi:hypothetical protein